MITIRLERDDAAYLPGEECRGELIWERLKESQKLELTLLWYTAGKGAQDISVLERRAIQAAGSAKESFRFALPMHPYGFSGALVTLTWAIEASAEGLDELQQRRDIIVSPNRQAIPLLKHPGGIAMPPSLLRGPGS